uniref:G-protein coupled receptors family 1 profile domain-containing protein n=1 Tax=Clastoptera arizonana TaxID=38151 RepID=A0A1B6CCX1_9HEMI
MNTSGAALAMAFHGGFPVENQEHLLGWNIPPEHGELVHNHWKGFLAPDLGAHFLLAAVYTLLMFSNILGNSIVIYLFFTTKSLRTPSNMFVINLAFFDLLMMLNMPMLIANSFYQRPVGWEMGCDIFGFLGGMSGMGSSINNAVIAYDRYRTIAFPLDGRLGMKQVGAMVFFTWLYASPFSFLPLFKVWGKYVPEGFLTTCSFDFLTQDDETKFFVGSIFVWSYVIPIFLIIIFYAQLIGHVRQHEKMLRDQAKKMNVKSLMSNPDMNQKSVEIRIAKVALTIVFLYLCSWTPYSIVALTGAFGDRSVLTPFMAMIPAVSAKIVSCIDPWIYAINHPKFRAEITKRMPWLGVQDESVSDAASVATEKTQTSGNQDT